jgi:Tol biopolymer transport system component
MTPLTNAGQSVCAAISPDGKSFAHVEKRDGMQELQMTNIANAGNSVVVPPADVTYRGVTFSRDGNYLYFTRTDKSDTGAVYGNAGTVYQVSLPGGTPRKIKDGVDSAISFSASGDRFAYLRTNLARREFSLLISGTDGTGERTIATKQDAGTLFVPPAWSPDDKTIVCAFGWWQDGYHTSLIEFDLETGREKAIGPAWYSVRQVSWLEDKSGLIVCANEQAVGPVQLWRVPYPQGSRSRITNDTANYETVSLSRDGNTMVSIQSRQEGQIWVAPAGDAQRARGIFSTVGRVNGLDWNSKGRIVFSSLGGENLVISSIEPDGSNRIQLTPNDSSNYTPATSPDGRFIVFASYRTGTLNIWRINAADGSEPKQLTFSDGNSYPSFSPDGQWVLYDNQSGTTFTVWKVPIEGGTPVQLTNEYSRMPAVSLDGQFIACRYLAEGSSREIAIFPFAGGAPIERLPIPVMDWQKVQWMPEGRALTYIDAVKGVSNIWRYDLGTRSARQLTDFKTERIFAYAWSPDFKWLACLRGTESRDVTVINNQP